MLQPAQLSLSDSQNGTADNHSGGATNRQSHTHSENRIDPTWVGTGIETDDSLRPRSDSKGSAKNHRASGNAEPDLRSLHTKLHLLKRVSVDCG
jgi:hypothetical protein